MADLSARTVWVFDEIYRKGMSNEKIAEEIIKAGYGKERIKADSAEPKSIDRLRELGIVNIGKARKGKDSVNSGIDFIKGFRIIVHPKCVNFITEISNYAWDRDGEGGRQINRPVDGFNHLMDAMRYALEDLGKGEMFSFK